MRANNKTKLYNINTHQLKGNTMTQSQFQDILRTVQSLRFDFQDGYVPEDASYEIAVDMIAEYPGLKEYINENIGASDAVGWLMHEM